MLGDDDPDQKAHQPNNRQRVDPGELDLPDQRIAAEARGMRDQRSERDQQRTKEGDQTDHAIGISDDEGTEPLGDVCQRARFARRLVRAGRYGFAQVLVDMLAAHRRDQAHRFGAAAGNLGAAFLRHAGDHPRADGVELADPSEVDRLDPLLDRAQPLVDPAD